MSLPACDFHMHTHFCDGATSPEEMVEQAIRLGFSVVGLSAHSPLPYENGYALTGESLPLYYKKIDALKETYKDKIRILNGIEWDSDTQEDVSGFDYRISSVHQLYCPKNGKHYPIDSTFAEFEECMRLAFDGDPYAMAEEYYRQLAEAAYRPGTDIVGHFDLIVKMNEKGGYFDESSPRYRHAALTALDTILDRSPDLLFEVNTGGISRGYRTSPYPADFLLRHMLSRRARLVLTSDAHHPSNIAFQFDDTVKLLRESGIKELWYLTGEGVSPIAL